MNAVRIFLFALAVLAPFSGCTPRITEVQLPVQSDGIDRLPPRPHVYEEFINIHPDGRIEAGDDGRYNSEEKLVPYLSSLFARNPNTYVVIRADRQAPHESVFRVLMLIRNTGFSKASLSTSLQDGTDNEKSLILNYSDY